ncbi:MAG: type II secretion system protein GspG [Planctomycetaceae bacterium]|jgi:hypothetical protein|nr:type II secretion system protein GspG [Planctomycetaceae bacterium]
MQKKPFYRQRRYWIAAIVLLIVCIGQVPMPLRVSKETSGIDSPICPDGTPDYFAVYEQTYIDKLLPAEDNGMSLIVAALGPKVLEQAALAKEVPWEQMPTNEQSKDWFITYYVPLCEHLGIDPYTKPHYYHTAGFYTMFKEKKLDSKEDPDGNQLYNKLVSAPFEKTDYLEVAQWLNERNPVLDLFGTAVRKTNYVCWHQRPQKEKSFVYAVLLPEMQAQREFFHDLRVRIAARLGSGDIDGAWYDIMSMLYLSRKHYIHQPFLVGSLIGFAAETQAYEALDILLHQNGLSQAQLTRFAAELSALPRADALREAVRMELLLPYMILVHRHYYHNYGGGVLSPRNPFERMMLMPLEMPIDLNIAGKQITSFYRQHRIDVNNDTDFPLDVRTLQERYRTASTQLERKEEYMEKMTAYLPLLALSSVRIRSQVCGDIALFEGSPALGAVYQVVQRVNARLEVMRLAILIERYKLDTGSYPQSLDKLVPKYIDAVPFDPCTRQNTLTYKLKPSADTAYLLYSFGPNGTDDGGIEHTDRSGKSDFVFKR